MPISDNNQTPGADDTYLLYDRGCFQRELHTGEMVVVRLNAVLDELSQQPDDDEVSEHWDDVRRRQAVAESDVSAAAKKLRRLLKMANDEIRRHDRNANVIESSITRLHHNEPRTAFRNALHTSQEQETYLNWCRNHIQVLLARVDDALERARHSRGIRPTHEPCGQSSPLQGPGTSSYLPLMSDQPSFLSRLPAAAIDGLAIAQKYVARRQMPQAYPPPPPLAHLLGSGGGIRMSIPTYHQGRGAPWPRVGW